MVGCWGGRSTASEDGSGTASMVTAADDASPGPGADFRRKGLLLEPAEAEAWESAIAKDKEVTVLQ